MNDDDATTVLEWTYEPMDLFEEPLEVEILSGSVHIEEGVARGQFPGTEYDRGAEFRDEVHLELERHFVGQAIIAGKQSILNPARLTREHPDGRRDANIIMGTGHLRLAAPQVSIDFVVRDKHGNVTADSRAERVGAQEAFRMKVADALPDFPEIKAMAESLNKSFEDEANCFVYLYEVRDRIATVFDGDHKARKALGVEKDWNAIGDLSNRPDNAMGRHRGRGASHSTPDQQTLQMARDEARRLIIAYVDHVSGQR